jgi:hypothetical protein
MEVRVQLQDPAALPPKKKYREARWTEEMDRE